ncbi:hypothetical protein O6H91_01G085800 [Diphasiastrum complanatum]|uniref:Uncharacterized protein n=2 Tax=Diphasiastrum complanatum TaxID=34168 RepID=A0ACC2ETB2_DIPCM|nr:hypothetical protein O6H91_01G085800 [Diphasiastrum complanatum]KAJ7569608.1 hypothetical protein O6H91_01G085800 [Diphasiastrum complanatum]
MRTAGKLLKACTLTDRSMRDRFPFVNVQSNGFNGHLSKLCKEGVLEEAVEEMEHLDQRGSSLSRDNAYHLLTRCVAEMDMTTGRRVYSLMLSSGLDSIDVLGAYLIRLFASCKSLKEADHVFSRIANPSVYTWNAIISANVKLGQSDRAIELYQKMKSFGVNCNSYLIVTVLNACASTKDLTRGRLIHEQIVQTGLQSNVFVGNALIDMYSKCGSIDEARIVFDQLPNRDIVSWNTMLTGYSHNDGHGEKAVQFFRNMQQQGIKPDTITFCSILKACGSMTDTGLGREIHTYIRRCGLQSDLVVGNALIDMYVKCRSIEEARLVFDRLPRRDVVSWSTLISGYVQHELGLEALKLFNRMQQEGIKPDNGTFASVLKACGRMAAVGQGKQIHAQILQFGLHSDVLVGSALVDMYARCGSLTEAREVFDKLPNKNAVSWGAMMGGYAQLGNCTLARQCFEDMQKEGLKPDKVTFLNMLVACSHKGLIDQGRQYFKLMTENYGIEPTIEHYTCMVDLFGRAGCLDEAENMLKGMPMPPNIRGWGSLLTACKTYGDVTRGRRCFDEMVKLDPKAASAYILMSNIYVDASMGADAQRIEELRKSAGAWKKPGRAWTEVNNEVHGFIVDDKTHPQSDSIYAKLRQLSWRMKEEGYVPKVELVLKPLSIKDKEDALCGHVEKLAVAFGLVSTPSGTTLRASKNLRVCNDCHSATKIISKLEKREIIIRDAYRLHHFKDGACSCEDYY